MAKAVKKDSRSVLTESSFEFFRNYINNPSPVGFESSGQKLWLEYIRPFIDKEFTDPYGTGVGIINPDQPFKVVLEAHVDEISWFVNYITNEGLIYLKRNGGVDHQIAPGQRVFIQSHPGRSPRIQHEFPDHQFLFLNGRRYPKKDFPLWEHFLFQDY